MSAVLFIVVIVCLFTNTEESWAAAQRQLGLLKSVIYQKDLVYFKHFHKVLEALYATTPVTYSGKVIFIARMTTCETASKMKIKEVYQNCEETGRRLFCTLNYRFQDKPEDYALTCDPIGDSQT
ncbi:hypothetical protein T4B_12370 [Trichinella pseudospiralis]|uniref:Cystatin domain-containing protein n=2 Tax=Trichinella pseudospiralis TaxID=6337 RepID=A0A0V1EJD1_TRIPS|nr:hypothetical protein T4E_5851 [Trichinella pseudospiralis]KRY73665.1 hypothetical protein T4A_9459 [Trichinella pseudospiralis]KRY89094.1 hypothetical protein T4D_3110 [Trichinella pseudospiralis]KRZ33789.1 hypothetical protein T4B_12370 [Trichinella pseudospiralis]KRZ37581.1 hypothetical protein T4C_13186 [Trichinella pseudospiralis]